MSFNSDPIKQAQEIIFNRNTSEKNHPEHLKSVLRKISKTVGLLRKFQGILPRTSLITTYKSFARLHLDCGDIIYDQTFTESFHQRIESIQHNAAIAITGAIRGTSSSRVRFRVTEIKKMALKLCLFYKIYKNKSPYLYDLIPDRVKFYSTRRSQINNISNIKTRSNFFRNSFFPSTITE